MGWHQGNRCQLSDHLKIIFRTRHVVFRNQREILKRITVYLNNFHISHDFLSFSQKSQNVDYRLFETSRRGVQNGPNRLKIETLLYVNKNKVLYKNHIHFIKTGRDQGLQNIDFFTF